MREIVFWLVSRSLLAPILLVLAACAQTAPVAERAAGDAPTVEGDFTGKLGPLRLALHLARAADGSLVGTLDSLDQGALGIACTDIRVEGDTLSLRVPSVNGSWTGRIEAGGARLVGTWSQGSPQPLTFERDTFVPAATPSAVDGWWLGTLRAPSVSLRMQLSVRSDASGREHCSIDSLDQGAFGLACANVTYSGRSFAFEVPQVQGRWSGELSEDGRSLAGTWTQGSSLPLDFQRQPSRVEASPRKPPTYAPALSPVGAADMQAVLRRDLEHALAGGSLASATGAGVSVGVVRDGERRVFALGSARPDSLFEIGSITKTFTGLMLAQLIEQGRVEADQPVRELFASGPVEPSSAAEISLIDLVTHRSGLPRLPDDLLGGDPHNPYAAYDAGRLRAFLARHGLQRPAAPDYLYSNVGLGLLGWALAERAGTDYAALVRQLVTDPLCMPDTVVALSAEQRARMVQGHAAVGRPTPPWDFDALVGAGGLRSSAGDMLTYLEAQLDAERTCSAPLGPAAATLAPALRLSQALQGDVVNGPRIAFAWFHSAESGTYWHGGATGGYSSFAFFNPAKRYAAIVLVNRTVDPTGASVADALGRHIEQRFAGEPALAIE